MEVVRDEVSASFLSSSISASDPSCCSELSVHWATGDAKLLRATLLERGMEEVGNGRWVREVVDR